MRLARRPPGAERGEVGMPVRAKYDRLAVDHGVIDGQDGGPPPRSWEICS